MTLSRSRIVCLTLLLFSAIARSGEMSMAEAERLLVESKDADLLFSLSFYYEEAGRPFSALRAVERALEIEAKKPAFHARYGQLLLGRRRLQEAAAAYAKAAALAPDAKFFKATEARAFAECGRWAEAISCWETLLTSASDSREALDAAANIERLAEQTSLPVAAERAWLAAMAKAQNTEERLRCATAAAEAMLRQGSAGRAVEHWEKLLANEQGWAERKACASGISAACCRAPAEERRTLLVREIAAWQYLLEKAGDAAQRQEAAIALASALLRAKEPAKAAAALAPHLRTGNWDQDMRAISALAAVYQAQGDAAALRGLWQKTLAEFHPLQLEAGREYEIKLEYYERGGGATIKLLWSGPDIPKQPVPAEVLIPAEGDGKAKGLRGEYFGSISFVDTKLVRLDSSINFDWGAGAPAPEVSADNFSCRWTGKLKPPRTGVYYFYTISDDGVRLWLDNRLLIDNWTDHAPTENSTSGYEERYPLFQRLAACAASAEETAEIWQKACEMFPGEAQPRADLAEALALAGKDDAAIAAYEEALKLISGRQESQHLYANFFSRLIAICCSRQRLEQAAELLLRYAPNNENIWITHQALYAIQGAGSAYSSMAAALKLAEAGGWRRVAAAEYLCQTPYRDLARSCLWAAVADQSLPGNYRYRLFDLLANLARDPGERAEMRRQQAAATSEIWQKSHALQMLARDLATEGKIGEALAVVEEADGVRQDNWSAGPQALAAMAQSVLQGRRVGPGLRSAEGLAKAENAVLDLYQRWRERDECAAGFSQLVTQLCQVRQQRGEHEAGLALLRRAAEVRDQSSIRLEIALLAAALAEAGKAPDPMPEFAAYAEAVAAEHNRAVAQNQNRRYALPNFDHRIGSLLERQKRQADFEKEISSRLEQRQGADRQALAEVLLSYQKQQGRLAEMEALLKKMDEWGFKDKLYTQEAEWVRRGLALKNAKSRADAEQRQRLLQDVARWEEVTKANAEDYQALFNLAKCHALLGDEDKSRQLVETARQRWPKDPVVLEIYARERMLDKGYAEAAQALAQAAEITGRRLDYEETMCSAYEMAGRFDLAIVLALDALESGLRSGQGFRTPEQIFDLAERSDNLAFLRQNLAARLQKKAEKTPNANLARLALRVAWQEADESLADAALSQLIFLAQQGNALTAEAALMPLAQQAEERQRLADAMRLRQAAIDVVEARGEAPRLSDYEALARLFLRAGKAVEAADLMFAGLRRALETGRPTPSSYKEMQFGRRRRDAQMAAAPFMPLPGSMQNQRLPWVQSIFNFVAAEHAAGGEAFRVAAGERLQALVEEEMKILAAKPRLYAGPLLNPGLEKALSLGERITAAFKQQCQKPDASADDHLALAERLTNTAVLTEDAGAPRPAFAEIAAACSAALEKAEPPAKPAIARSRCRIYRRLFALPAQARLPELSAEIVLQAYEAALALALNLDLLQEAVQFARDQKKIDRHVEWARKRYQIASGEASARADLAAALFAAGAAQEAVDLLRKGLDKHATHVDYRAAAEICWQQAPAAPPAAEGAAEFCQAAVRLYEEAAGAQVDAQGKPLPDAELAALYNLLARCHAACGKPDEAWQALLAFAARSAQPPLDDPAIAAVAEAFAKAKRGADLVRLVEARVNAEPKSSHLRVLHANFLAGLGEYAAAADAMRAARALQPDLAIVKRLIRLLRQAGDLRLALAETMAWAESFPRDAEAYQTMAEIYRELKDEVGEMRSLTMLVEVAPRDADNCRKMAAIFLERGEARRAVGLLERAVDLRPEEPYRHIDLAEALFAAQELPRAEAVCREALARDWEKGLSPELLARLPQWRGTFEHRGHALLAEILEAQGKKDEASRERLQVPAGYKRPAFKEAVPTAQPRWPIWRGPLPVDDQRRLR